MPSVVYQIYFEDSNTGDLKYLTSSLFSDENGAKREVEKRERAQSPEDTRHFKYQEVQVQPEEGFPELRDAIDKVVSTLKHDTAWHLQDWLVAIEYDDESGTMVYPW